MASLMISRNRGQTVEIGDPCNTGDLVKITIADTVGGQVRLRIDAPLDVVVNRSEIGDRVRATDGGGTGKKASQSRVDLVSLLKRQREWSVATFGPGDLTASLVDHIEEELDEVEQAPGDATEWADIVLLALDGMMRTGLSAEEAVQVITRKFHTNTQRQWPDWRTVDRTKAIGHIQPAVAEVA
ncbi:dATP/dGTP pyrophosphohydrolase domain-containing protein [Xanthomonas euvesicatoria]